MYLPVEEWLASACSSRNINGSHRGKARRLSPLTLVWNDAERPRWTDTRGHRRRTPHVPRSLGLQPRLLRVSGLSRVLVVRHLQARNIQVSGYTHLPTHSPRPLKRSLWPAAYAAESGDVSRGIPSREMITDAQYAPLEKKRNHRVSRTS